MTVRWLAKRIVHAAAWLTVLPLVVLAGAERRVGGGEGLFRLGSHLLAIVPGAPGVALRAAFYSSTLTACSWETHIGFGSVFVHRNARMGVHASCGHYCVFGHVDIGSGVMIGSRVSIPSGKRQHFDERGRLSYGAGTLERVAVGDGCWIGEGAILLANVGRECIVAAGAVVTQAVPARTLVAGNPAGPICKVETAE